MQGVSLAIENDGTRVDNDEELLFVKDQALVVLEADQVWTSEDCSSTCTNISSATTLTVNSMSSDVMDDNTFEEVDLEKMPLVIVDHNSEMCWRQFNIWKNIPNKLMKDLNAGN